MLSDPQEAAISTILDSPQAPNIIQRLQEKLVTEQQRREQFYADIDDDVKAEFINGEIIIHSPVKKEHTDVVANLLLLLKLYVRKHALGYVGYEKVLIALSRNDYEPDLVFFNKEKSANFQKGHWKYPAPDFVVEVLSYRTKDRDRGIKYQDYEAHGVTEYWLVEPTDETIEQYVLTDGKYVLKRKTDEGTVASVAVADFALNVRALFDEEANTEAVRVIMES
ncbi:MAG: Uma2 family endonuclease [Bacteroidota bacterium]